MSTVSLNSTAGRWVMVSTILASAMAFIDGTALNVVLPSLQKHLHATAEALFWVINSYMLILAALILIGGSLGDRLGRKRIYMTGITIFVLGSAACGCSSTAGMLIFFRIIQGLGGALMIPGSLALISSSINEDERGRAIGTWSAVTTLVTMGGPALGGALADAGLWRAIFFINLPIGIIAWLILAAKVAETRDTEAPSTIDYPGALLIAGGLAAVTFGFLRMPTLGFAHPQIYGTIGTGVILLVLFVMVEKRSRYPMLPMTLFSNRVFSSTNLLTFFLYAGLSGGMLFLSLNLIQVQGYTQLESGLTFLPFTILMIFLSRLAGSLADKWGARYFLIAGPVIAGFGLFLLSRVGQTTGAGAYWQTFFPGIFVLGLGMSLTVAPLTATVMGAVSSHLSGTASGVNNAITRIAAVFAVAVLGALAVVYFSGDVARDIQHLQVNSAEQKAILAQTADLGNATAPAGLPPAVRSTVTEVYHRSFIHAYRQVMWWAAVSAWFGALMILLFAKKRSS
ncbi:MFS transporter [Chitinophaga sp. Cy-1792]|uniref:MFS transporter n=1 Tax=Chitinophaga sp. Cy-1792 TaxID=2608339 RepID=UPI00141F054F|nr:MFS transporter [Chitinophaga sp. Cy-1792]NIG55579.1 MFS transporter [Chitinophaga sp. Cy-1792]